MTFTGSKLGNDFKWTTLRNKLDYQQERDRAVIQQANAQIQDSKLDSGTSLKSKQSDNAILQGSHSSDILLLLPDHTLADIFHAENPPDSYPESMLELKRKRIKRKRRLGR